MLTESKTVSLFTENNLLDEFGLALDNLQYRLSKQCVSVYIKKQHQTGYHALKTYKKGTFSR